MARKIGIVVALVVVVGAVVVMKRSGPPAATSEVPATRPVADRPTSQPTAPLPRLVDLGRGKCMACKKMMPILAELKKTYAGRLRVDVIDLGEDPEAGDRYNLRLIPTQIFFDPAGKERFRHEGFMPRSDILAKWKELGFDLDAATSRPAGT